MAASEVLHQTKENIESADIARRHANSLEKSGISVDQFLNPSREKDWKKIKYYKRINNTIKRNFLQFELFKFEEPKKFSKQGYHGDGREWDKRLSDCIKKIIVLRKSLSAISSSDLSNEGPAVKDLFVAIGKYVLRNTSSMFRSCIEFLESKFPLFGFMRERATDGMKTPKLYLWQGEVDAIAYNETLKKFIIVDFKVVDNLLDYWQTKTDLCGKHLHQCLVYAKLLQLHMKLDYLPPIMIVVIHRFTGNEGFFLLFKDYPEECKDKLDEYEWFTEQPPKLPLKMVKKREDKLFCKDIVGFDVDDNCVDIPSDTPLNEIFKKTATVGDLLKALHLDYDALDIHVPYLDE